MKKLQKLFSGKTVLITGNTGFKGSWLCVALNELGANVTGYALAPESGDSHFSLLDLEKSIRHVVGDIRDIAKLQNVFDSVQPEFVFHLAAQALVRRSYENPKLTFDTNVAGSVNVLEAVRKTPTVRSFVYITSDKCYLNREWEWGYRENDELGGHDPYSASKAASELVFSAYQNSYFAQRETLGASSVRAGNVIGGGDWAADRLVPDVLAALHSVKFAERGLAGYGKPGNYFERQIGRWSKQYVASITQPIPEMDQLMAWLPANIPPGDETSVVHGDYRCDNMIFHPTEPRVIAVLDWELSTLGDPMADFTYLLMQWAMPGLQGVDLKALNIPSEEEYLAAYCRNSGRDSLPGYDFAMAFNFFRFAAIIHGIKGRYLRGTAANAEAKSRADAFPALAELAWDQAVRAGA